MEDGFPGCGFVAGCDVGFYTDDCIATKLEARVLVVGVRVSEVGS